MVFIFLFVSNLQLFNTIFSAKAWFNYDPQSDSTLKAVTPLTTNWMRRRYFYIEKCKDAKALGIVVGTLVAKGYLDLVKHIQALARYRGVRTYLISVGKVNPSKLANFSEIDCFVLIGCWHNLISSRDYYKPLLSVFEVEMALNPAWHDKLPENYCVDFKELLPEGRFHRDFKGQPLIEGDVSLVSGQIRFATDLNDQKTADASSNIGTVQVKKNHQVMSSDSSTSFQMRSFTGLDQALGKTEAAKIEQGRAGLSIKYDNDLPS